MEKFKSIKLTNVSLFKVMAKKDENIFDVAEECIDLYDLFETPIRLYYGEKEININATTTIQHIVQI